MSETRKDVIVAIHGVGAPAVGTIITQLSALRRNSFYHRSDITVNKITFARLTTENGPDLLEVNWADIKRPSRSIVGVVKWVLELSFALSRARGTWPALPPPTNKPSDVPPQFDETKQTGVGFITARLHAILFELLLLWVLFPVLLGLMHANLNGFWTLLIADAAVIGLAILILCACLKTTYMAQIAGG